MKLSTPKNPFLFFLPLLVLYFFIVFFLHSDTHYGDENRYLIFANNLLNGIYSPPPPDIDLSNGPGYPLLIMPFLALNLPLITISLFNAILYYLSVVLLYISLKRSVNLKLALAFSLFWGFYINALEFLPVMLSEILILFLSVLFLLLILHAVSKKPETNQKFSLIASGVILGAIILTKTIFGYVLLVMMVGNIALLFYKRRNRMYQKSMMILLIGFMVSLPFLIYSYSLTNRVFYWSSVGGNNLYWMSTPHENEYGSWMSFEKKDLDTLNLQNKVKPHYFSEFSRLHYNNMQEIFKKRGAEQDDAYKALAIKNIKNHPVKFLKNCFSNLSRILFNFPYSYKLQNSETFLRIPFNGLLVILIFICLFPTLKNWTKVEYSIKFLLLFSGIYLGGSILASAETRMFSVVVPFFIYWVATILSKTIKFNFKIEEGTSQ